MLASLHPCSNNHPNRVSDYSQYFDKSNIREFDFIMDLNAVMSLNLINHTLSLKTCLNKIKMFGKHKLKLIEIVKNISDRVIGLMKQKNLHVFFENIHIISGNQNWKFVC